MSESKLCEEASPQENINEHVANREKYINESFESRSNDPNCGENLPYRNKNMNTSVSPQTEPSRKEGIEKTLNQEQCFNQKNMFNIQSAMAAQDAFLRSGYDAMQAYYGWLPGITPMRFPAFFYPPSFIGFPPNFGQAPKNTSSEPTSQDETEKGFNHAEQNKEDTETSEATHKNNNKGCDLMSSKQNGLVDTYDGQIDKDFPEDVVSDIDEGMVLEQNDSEERKLKRRRPAEESEKYNQERRVATVSVIQENCSIKKAIRHINDNHMNSEENIAGIDPSAKRGRASTRQIEKTEQYWDRRKKNNVSAKKSRDARRQREIITNQRSAMLEAESLRLRAECATLREENERLKKQLSSLKPS